MAEYIEREALLKKLIERDLCLCVSESDIKDIPAADVAPVVHGRWIQTMITQYNGEKPCTQFAHNCSFCNWLNKKKKGWNTKFCPNCGAKMRGDSGEE